jgi:FAD/FMN-containing dehydrogenase
MKRRPAALATTPLSRDPVQELRTSFRGTVLQPEDSAYDKARGIWNRSIDKHPRVIARCAGPDDVVRAVAFAREHALPIAVRGGGHGVAGQAVCDDGLVVDLSAMKGIRVEPSDQTVRAQAGVLWGELDRATQVFGLATTGGVVSTTGIAGLTLGGGFGWLMRKHGMTIDNLLSVDVVTADGDCLTASCGQNADLFWAIRGAGVHFGVVTSFEYCLHRVGPVLLGGMVLHPLDRAEAGLRFYREFTRDAPEELTTYAVLLTTPGGMPMLALIAVHAGALDAAEKALRPLRSFGAPPVDRFAPTPYVMLQTLFDAGSPAGRRYYEKSIFLDDLDDDGIHALVRHFTRVPSPFSGLVIEHHGGAIRRVPEDASAFRHRGPEYNLTAPSSWADARDTEANLRWSRDVVAALAPPGGTGAYYANYDGDAMDEARVRTAFGANYDRLAEIKSAYDPLNVFSSNANIAPSA